MQAMTNQYPARDDLFASHRYLCRRGANKFVRRGLERTDLEQVAAIGLVKACNRYDASTRTPFEAFAWLLILGELMHHVRDHEHPVRQPRWIRGLERSLAAASERLVQRLQRAPTDAEVARELCVPVRAVHELRRAVQSRTHQQLQATHEPLERDDPAIDRVLVESALAACDPSARAVVLGIYALGLSRTDIGRRYGLSPRAVARLHDGALRSMRQALRAG